MNPLFKLSFLLALGLFAVKTASAVQCLYFPREFISHSEISNKTITQHRCSALANVSNSWNEFLKSQINFLLLQQCVIYTETGLTASESCIAEIKQTFQPLFNNPLCKNAAVYGSYSWACMFDPLNPCLKSEQAGPKGNVLSLLCKLKLLGKNWLHGLKGSLKSMGLDIKQLHFYTAGRYIDFHGLRGSSSGSGTFDKDTYDFIGNAMCSKHPDGNCCSGPSGCNMPKRLNQTSFFAKVGVKEIMNAYGSDGYMRQYLASVAGVRSIQHPSGNDDDDEAAMLGKSGTVGHHRGRNNSWLPANNRIVAVTLGTLAFACLALLACLLAVCYNQQRRKRRQQSDQSDSLLKAPSPPPEHHQQQQQSPQSGQLSFPNGLQHQQRDSNAAAEKLLSASDSSSSAFACCPAPQQQQQRMFAVPNNRSGGGGGGGGGSSSSGVCTGDSLPSTTENVDGIQQQQTSADAVVEFDNSQTGSGSGQPILLPRTVAREIEHRELIGQGRFGQVYRSEWRNDPVAVKIFTSRAESSWSTEGHMYELPGMRHDAILGFIAIDNIDIGLETQLWLITDYHANGSLQSYLTNCTVDQHTMARMLHSIARGLTHLHSEISGVKCKPAIAHRDIKSNNILVKADLSCCIADFGLAVALQPGCGGIFVGFGSGGPGGIGSSDSGIGETNNNGRIGTRRYLSPECLNGSQDSRDFTALRKADIYATGLVFWELAARCNDPARGIAPEPVYQQPYQDLVPNNPTLEEMQAVVCPPASARPPLSAAWREHPVLDRLCQVLAECWYESPAARLEAMSVKDQTGRMLQTANELLANDNEVGTVIA